MSRTLVLIRHGRPEPKRAGAEDFDRELTAEGAATLDAPDGLARSLSLLPEDGRAEAVVWTSPAVRARKTAEAASRALAGAPIEEHETLWEQDNAGFIAELAASDARCVVACGHIPFMDEMVAYLADTAVRFTPGAAAALSFDGEPRLGSCWLEWFVRLPE